MPVALTHGCDSFPLEHVADRRELACFSFLSHCRSRFKHSCLHCPSHQLPLPCHPQSFPALALCAGPWHAFLDDPPPSALTAPGPPLGWRRPAWLFVRPVFMDFRRAVVFEMLFLIFSISLCNALEQIFLVICNVNSAEPSGKPDAHGNCLWKLGFPRVPGHAVFRLSYISIISLRLLVIGLGYYHITHSGNAW